MWVNPQTSNNLVVLTADMLYVASVWKSELPTIDLGLEKGTPVGELLPGKAYKIGLKNIESFQLKHTQVVVHQLMNKDVKVRYRDGTASRNVVIQFETQQMRDEFVNKLNEKLGTWRIKEKHEAPILILANYLYIIFVIGLLAILFSAIGLFFPPNDDNSLPSRYWYATGPWGLVVPAVVISVLVLIVGVWQLRRPPIIVSYEP